jgi:agmatine deiminase
MPAEWLPHSATLLAWPHQKADWPGRFAPIPWVYCEIIRHVTLSEPVVLLIPPGTKKAVSTTLSKAGIDLRRITLLPAATDRVWVRDSGPIGVCDDSGQPVLLDWKFNAWAKYDNWRRDDRVPAIVAKHLKAKAIQPELNGRRVVLEGGAIDVNGAGLLLTTEECLLSAQQCRNPGLHRSDYEAIFAKYLGITKTIWLHQGIVGDDTHGHVDDLTRFVNERTVVTVMEDNAADPNHALLQENLDRLRSQRGLDIITLPMPDPVIFRGQRLPASYANFYIANEVVLVPTFNDPTDRIALGTLADLFPERKVVGIHAVDLIWGLGTLHCLSQQLVSASPGTPG